MLSEETQNGRRKKQKVRKGKPKGLKIKKPTGGFRIVFQHEEEQERLKVNFQYKMWT